MRSHLRVFDLLLGKTGQTMRSKQQEGESHQSLASGFLVFLFFQRGTESCCPKGMMQLEICGMDNLSAMFLLWSGLLKIFFCAGFTASGLHTLARLGIFQVFNAGGISGKKPKCFRQICGNLGHLCKCGSVRESACGATTLCVVSCFVLLRVVPKEQKEKKQKAIC